MMHSSRLTQIIKMYDKVNANVLHRILRAPLRLGSFRTKVISFWNIYYLCYFNNIVHIDLKSNICKYFFLIWKSFYFDTCLLIVGRRLSSEFDPFCSGALNNLVVMLFLIRVDSKLRMLCTRFPRVPSPPIYYR